MTAGNNSVAADDNSARCHGDQHQPHHRPRAPGNGTDGAVIMPSVEIKGTIPAVDSRAGTITIRDDDGPATVVALRTAAASYHLGQQVDVTGTPAGPGGGTTTVRAQVVTLEDAQATPDASDSAAEANPELPDSSGP